MAMEGLAASDSTSPAAMMTRTAASSARSTVNHHSTSKLRSARDSLMARLAEAREPARLAFGCAAVRAKAPLPSSSSVLAQLDTRQSGHQGAEMIAAHLEICVLIV